MSGCKNCEHFLDHAYRSRLEARRSNRFAFAMALVAFAAVLFAVLMLNALPSAAAATVRAPHAWKATTATWYGPGLYGNRTACGQTYTTRIRGVAIGRTSGGRWLAACGDRFAIRRGGRTVRVTVIDRCPGCVGEGHRFDLSARTAQDLCSCSRPYTMRVRWRRAAR